MIKKATSTAEKSLVIDIYVANVAYKNNDLSKLDRKRSNFNPALALTKQQNESILFDNLKNASLDHHVKQ